MDNISIFEDIKRLENTYHCDICGNKVKCENVPLDVLLRGGFIIICDECKEAIKYAKELRRKEVMKSRDSISYTYVTRYYAATDKEDWDGYNKIHHYSVSVVKFPENQVSDANMYNNDISYFTNYEDAQRCCDILNRDWEKIHGEQ